MRKKEPRDPRFDTCSSLHKSADPILTPKPTWKIQLVSREAVVKGEAKEEAKEAVVELVGPVRLGGTVWRPSLSPMMV